MSSNEGILGFVWDFLSLPFSQYDTFTGERDWVATILLGFIVLVVVVVVLIVLLGIVGWVLGKIIWLVKRKHCQHEVCGRQWTTVTRDGSEPGCVNGEPCCESCARRHARDAARRCADQEPHYNCVHGHGPMQKKILEVLNGEIIVVDTCEAKGCGGVWFNGDELTRVKELARQQGYDDGVASARSGNLAVGIAIGSTI